MAMSGKGGPLGNVTTLNPLLLLLPLVQFNCKSGKSRFKAGQNKLNLCKAGGFLNNQVRPTF